VGKNTQMHNRKKHKITPPTISHISFKSEQSEYKRWNFNCVFAFCFFHLLQWDCSVALTQLFGYTCKTQSHLVGGNQQSSCQQKSECDGHIIIAQEKRWLGNSRHLSRLTKAHCKLLF